MARGQTPALKPDVAERYRQVVQLRAGGATFEEIAERVGYAGRQSAKEAYDAALLEKQEAFEPKFNKANSYYRLEDLDKAVDLYREVAAESKDMGLVAKAKYNLGNCFFEKGAKEKDSDLEKALKNFEDSITQ